MFQLLYADEKGRMYEHAGYQAVGRTGNIFTELEDADTVVLPEGAGLVLIPGGIPVGVSKQGNFGIVDKGPDNARIFAVGALLPQGYTRTMVPAYRRADESPLPLFGYAAVGWKNGEIRVAAIQTDVDLKWNPVHYSTPELDGLVESALTRFPNNRIIRQLGQCATQYSCFTAQNIFYGRWEGGIPVSPACNAACLGCISLQPAECCPSPQTRIDFAPSADEIVELAVPHLNQGVDAIVSFGQGCEGEPSLAAPAVSEAIRQIRRHTQSGTINMNTNGGYTEGIRAVCTAGIDSLRVSTISALEPTYDAYYNPRGYKWSDVRASIAFARDNGVFVSLNLLTFPGLTDTPEETEALVEFIRKMDINMVQIRNLNIDPDYLAQKIVLGGQEALGIRMFVDILKRELPNLSVGNYSQPVKRRNL
ncbi:MAG TPA: radical SAM protein [Desulfobacteria bacterium]|nr:radical SAM protein [Desulfobacteria bacterium]